MVDIAGTKQFTDHELSIMLIALDMAMFDITRFEKEAKRNKEKERRRICQIMFLQVNGVRQKAERLLHDVPFLADYKTKG